MQLAPWLSRSNVIVQLSVPTTSATATAFLIFLVVGRGMPPTARVSTRSPLRSRCPIIDPACTYTPRLESASCSIAPARCRTGRPRRKRCVLRASSSDAVCLVVTPRLFRKSSTSSIVPRRRPPIGSRSLTARRINTAMASTVKRSEGTERYRWNGRRTRTRGNHSTDCEEGDGRPMTEERTSMSDDRWGVVVVGSSSPRSARV